MDGAEAYVAIGFRLPDGSPHTAADVHLVKVGTGADAPWEVVGTRDTTLTLDRPAYGSTVASPMTVGGRITGATSGSSSPCTPGPATCTRRRRPSRPAASGRRGRCR